MEWIFLIRGQLQRAAIQLNPRDIKPPHCVMSTIEIGGCAGLLEEICPDQDQKMHIISDIYLICLKLRFLNLS